MKPACLCLLLLLAGCQPEAGAPAAPAANVETPAAVADSTSAAEAIAPTEEVPAGAVTVETWLGTWTGPEGTSLQLSRADQGHGYRLVITDLDGPSTFDAVIVGDHLRFERNGVQETLRASNGAATGMKWLQDKKDCLTINSGEGFCRD